MTIRSESPYQRNGRTDATLDQRARRYNIRGTETVFFVAHTTIGEWREWRKVPEENDIADVFNLRGYADRIEGFPIVAPIELDAGGGTEEEDFTADLGQAPDFEALSPELEGVGFLLVEDLEPPDGTIGEDFTIAFQAPGDAAGGDPVAIKYSRFFDADGVTQTTQRVLVFSESGEWFLDLRIDIDFWLVAWLFRCVPLKFEPASSATRDTLVVPTLELPRGRGDA